MQMNGDGACCARLRGGEGGFEKSEEMADDRHTENVRHGSYAETTCLRTLKSSIFAAERAPRRASVKFASMIASVLAGVSGMASAWLMSKGTASVPWSIQTYGGESSDEVAFRQKARRMWVWGLGTMACAFVLSAAAAVLGYLAP